MTRPINHKMLKTFWLKKKGDNYSNTRKFIGTFKIMLFFYKAYIGVTMGYFNYHTAQCNLQPPPILMVEISLWGWMVPLPSSPINLGLYPPPSLLLRTKGTHDWQSLDLSLLLWLASLNYQAFPALTFSKHSDFSITQRNEYSQQTIPTSWQKLQLPNDEMWFHSVTVLAWYWTP